MAVINTNVKALFSQMALKSSGLAQSTAMQQLSTGKRINSARDDAAGMAIATRMTHQIRSLNQAVRNSNDAINLIQTAEGATNEITDMLQRMRELSIQAINDTNDNAQRSYLDLEFQQLKQQIVQISDNTEWNGFPVLNGKAGERVGEMPVYKATATSTFGDVFISPTTNRTVSGVDAGEQQTLNITGTPKTGTIKIGGVDVTITNNDVASVDAFAAKIKSTLSADPAFNLASGRSVTQVTTPKVQTFNFSNPTAGTFVMDGVKVTISAGDAATSTTFATAVKNTLEADPVFKTKGRTLALTAAGALSVTYSAADGDAQLGFASTQASPPYASLQITGAASAPPTKAQTTAGSAATPATEVDTVTFVSIKAGQSITVAGLTYTATADSSAADLVAAYTGLQASATTPANPAKGVFSGNLVAFNATGAGAATVTFTSTTPNAAVTQISVSGTASTETSDVTFADLTAGQSITVAGLTYISKGATSAADVATAFSNLALGTPADTNLGYFTGALAGYTSGQSVNGTKVTFTSTTSGVLASHLSPTSSAPIATTAVSTSTQPSSLLTLTYAPSDGNAPDTAVLLGSTNVSVSVASIRPAVTQASESFVRNGAFTKSGALSISIPPFGSGPAIALTTPGAVGTKEVSTVTFADLTDGQSVQVAGLTYTSKGATTAAQLAAAFAGATDGSTPANPSTGTFTGKLTNYGAGAAVGTAIAFTSSKTGVLSSHLTTLGASNNVTASFLTSDNQTVVMTGTIDTVSGKVTFLQADGNNKSVISDDLVYTLKDSLGGAKNVSDTRGVSLTVNIEGSIPALRAGDLRINGVDIGASYASDDLLSPVNNAAGSAIAKAAAINRKAVDSGVSTAETQSITFSGSVTPGTIVVGGVSVNITANDNTSVLVAAKVAAALKASTLYDSNSGRTIDYAVGSSVLSVNFAKSERDVAQLTVESGTTGMQAVVDTTVKSYQATPGTGVFAKVNENILTGTAMNADSVVKGAVFINGFTSADITTVLNNTRESRAAVANAINLISDKTGVKAIDTGSDAQGITLVAKDGRNIEVRFETNSNADVFSQRTGLRQGVQAGTYSLESKIQAPIILSSATTGDISRAGLIEGNFTKNQSVFNTSPRETVTPAKEQTESLTFSGAILAGDTYSITINGKTFDTTGKTSAQSVRQALADKINANTTLGVKADAGNSVGELILTAATPGLSFTMASSSTKATGSTGAIKTVHLQDNVPSQFKPLGTDDLVINGVKIRPTTSADDLLSTTAVMSSDRSASAIAIANAINASSVETGVRAIANPVVSKSMFTDTSLPETGNYSLFVNGTEVSVYLEKGETGTARRDKVVAAINMRTGQHGITAANNGNGVTMSSDGRNMAVWFDSNITGLSAASFGLDKGGAMTQVSRITVGGTVGTQTASINLNGVTITSGAAASSAADMAAKLKAAIDTAISNGTIKNITVSYNAGDTTIDISSAVAGSPFELKGAATSGDGPSLTLATVQANSMGANDVTAIRGSTSQPAATSNMANTLYGTVRMISDPALLPKMPAPGGTPPSDQLAKVNATGQPFTISTGSDGFGVNSNFAAMGFEVGTFGGRSSEEMDPPRVGRLAFQVGASANQLVTIDLADFGKGGPITSDITGDVDLNVEQRTARINTREGASDVLAKLDNVMDKVNATRSTMGAVMNRLDHVINNLTNVSMNLSASRSTIEDADYASASTELAKTQIMQQAATAVLAQANTSQQTVLKLLGG